MSKIRIGVLCPSNIAFRRFMPALKKISDFEFVGIAAATEKEWCGTGSDKPLDSEIKKAEDFIAEYGGEIFGGYNALVTSNKLDAVYIPLPPALHCKWAMAALESGKHALVEKPFTTELSDTQRLIDAAKERGLAVHENYMFVYHSQLDYITEQMRSGVIGDIRLIRADFGFPFRGAGDFRYEKALGGGALLDCGGYTLKLASLLLGESAELIDAHLNYKDGFEVDIYGSATVRNSEGLTAQLSFGMDNAYRCNLDIWGSKGSIFTDRILTAPDGFEPTVTIKTADGEQKVTLPADDTFRKSIEAFAACVNDPAARAKKYDEILGQARLVGEFGRKTR